MQRIQLRSQANSAFAREEAALCFKEIFEDDVSDQEVSSFLTSLSQRNLEPQEVCGFLDYLTSQSRECNLGDSDLFDVCGTGGDGKNTINISTISAFVLAALGEKVAKHGNYSASSSIGSSNLLEALKIPFIDSPDQARKLFDKTGIIFLHAPIWHPKLKKVAAIRKALGFRTVFNLLGPLLNPAKPKYQLIGTASEENARLLSGALSLRDKIASYAILFDRNGYDEVSLTAEVLVIDREKEFVLSSGSYGTRCVDPLSLNLPATLEEVVDLTLELLSGRAKEEHFFVVAANVATALKLKHSQVSYQDLFSKALDCMKSGAPLAVLNSIREYS